MPMSRSVAGVVPPGPRRSSSGTNGRVSAPTDESPFDDELLTRGRLVASKAGPVVTITLDRPDIRNAQLPVTWEALAHVGSRVPADTRVVVVKGSGASFSAGLDRSAFAPGQESMLMQIASAPDAVAHNMIAEFQRGFTWLSDPAFISIAAVQGYAIGAGFQLALACDLVIAADDAQFSMAEVKLGLVPDLSGTGRLTRAVGYQRALEICATGRRVSAGEAVQIGLALTAVPADDLDQAVADLTHALISNPIEAVRGVTRLIGSAVTATPEDQLEIEQDEQLNRLRELAAPS